MKKIILASVIMFFTTITSAMASDIAVADVKGLVCDFCAQALEKTFAKEERVDQIKVNLDESTVTVYFKEGQNLTDAEIEDLISRGGYDISGIQRVEKSEDLQN